MFVRAAFIFGIIGIRFDKNKGLAICIAILAGVLIWYILAGIGLVTLAPAPGISEENLKMYRGAFWDSFLPTIIN
ncbi:MAG: hypothetical protein AMJ79_11945 [Phycisphaerae bacterium SM23_30]|nr:MAG: hypothetical protein AMJ79_11945 [Phycisphaerae bacterium SM23_30]